MNFLPQNPKTRQMVLIGIIVGVLLLVFGFFFATYFTPTTPEEIQRIQAEQGGQGRSVSEGEVKRLEGGIIGLKKELENDFYKTLRKRAISPDTTAPGKQNPFE